MKKIDCHTHIISKEVRDEYFAKTDNYAIVMQFPDSIMKNPECVETVRSDPRLFLCPAVDMKAPADSQVKTLRAMIADPENKIVGLKIYTSYQRGAADDEKLFPIYDFCAEERLSVTFHTGICSLVLPSDQDLEGSGANHIAKAAEKFPTVNFIAAHMDDPYYERCTEIMATHDNVWSDFCGIYETGAKECEDIDGTIGIFRKAIAANPGCIRRMMYGTDFCPPINLSQIEEYDYSIEKLFDKKDFDDIYFGNAMRAFPRLAYYIKL